MEHDVIASIRNEAFRKVRACLWYLALEGEEQPPTIPCDIYI